MGQTRTERLLDSILIVQISKNVLVSPYFFRIHEFYSILTFIAFLQNGFIKHVESVAFKSDFWYDMYVYWAVMHVC